MAKDYIEREAAVELFHNAQFEYTAEEAAEFVSRIPAADVVEVVRCRDCKFYKLNRELANAEFLDPDMYCGLHGMEMPENGYCSFGANMREVDNA